VAQFRFRLGQLPPQSADVLIERVEGLTLIVRKQG
jgi:hypothetical protein